MNQLINSINLFIWLNSEFMWEGASSTWKNMNCFV